MRICRTTLCKYKCTVKYNFSCKHARVYVWIWLQDEDREGRPLVVPTEHEEFKAYVLSTSAYSEVADLEGAHVVQRRQQKFRSAVGESPINFDELRHAANRLDSLQYNVPVYIHGPSQNTPQAEALQDVSYVTWGFPPNLNCFQCGLKDVLIHWVSNAVLNGIVRH